MAARKKTKRKARKRTSRKKAVRKARAPARKRRAPARKAGGQSSVDLVVRVAEQMAGLVERGLARTLKKLPVRATTATAKEKLKGGIAALRRQAESFREQAQVLESRGAEATAAVWRPLGDRLDRAAAKPAAPRATRVKESRLVRPAASSLAQRRGRRRIVALAILALLLLGPAAWKLIPVQTESHGDGIYRSHVMARFLDAETRVPLAGVEVVALREMSQAGDVAWIEGRRRAHDGYPDAPTGHALSGKDGAVELRTSAPFVHNVRKVNGRVIEDSGLPLPGYGVAGVVAEKPGYLRLVVETPRDRWTAVESRNHDDPAAALDLGDLLLKPE